MNKKNIIKKAAINADLTVKEEQKAVEAFLCAVSDILKEDREVFLPDCGRFYVRKCAERQVRNPQTGEMMTVPATKRIRFKPSGSITHYTLKYSGTLDNGTTDSRDAIVTDDVTDFRRGNR